MIYPNIHIISKNENIYFNRSFRYNTNHYSFLKDIIIKDDSIAVVVISQIVENYKNVIKYLKNKNFKIVYFFIDDVFRLNLSRKTNDTFYDEIEIIKKIIKKLNLKSYKIFHCEITKEYGYSDLYLYNWLTLNKFNYKEISYKFNYSASCFNNRSDYHRQLIGLLLCQKKNVFLTLNEHLCRTQIFNNNLFNIANLDEKIKKNLYLGIKYFKNKKNAINHLDKLNKKIKILKPVYQNNELVYKNIKNSFVNIVTETTFISDYVYFSEKTFKPILCYRPFIMLAPAGSLKKLKEFGFKTFDEWWDESYDEEKDHILRFQKAYYEIENILSKSKYDLDQILLDMTETLIHNKKHIENFKKNLLPVF